MKPACLLPSVACAAACLLSSCDTATGYVRQLQQSDQGSSKTTPGTPSQKTAESAPLATAAKADTRSTGTITVNSTGFGSNEDAAVRDACNNAVKEAFGFLLDGKSVLKNGELIEDIKSLSSGIVEKYTVNRRSSEGPLIKAEITAVVKKGGLYQALEATKVSKRGVDGKALGNAISQEIAREATFVEIYTRIVGEYLPNAISVEIPEESTEIIDKTTVAIRVSVKVTPNPQAKAIFKERLELLLDQAATRKQRLTTSHIIRARNGDFAREGFYQNGDRVSATAGAYAFPFSTESFDEGLAPGATTCPKDSLLGKESIAFQQCKASYVFFEPKDLSNNPLTKSSVTIMDDDGEDGTVYFLSDSMYERAFAARNSAAISYGILVQAVDENKVVFASTKIHKNDHIQGDDRMYLGGYDFKTFAPGFLLKTYREPRFCPLGSLLVCKTLKIAPADISRLHAFHASVIPSAK